MLLLLERLSETRRHDQTLSPLPGIYSLVIGFLNGAFRKEFGDQLNVVSDIMIIIINVIISYYHYYY